MTRVRGKRCLNEDVQWVFENKKFAKSFRCENWSWLKMRFNKKFGKSATVAVELQFQHLKLHVGTFSLRPVTVEQRKLKLANSFCFVTI